MEMQKFIFKKPARWAEKKRDLLRLRLFRSVDLSPSKQADYFP
jgi:hypothetical protein